MKCYDVEAAGDLVVQEGIPLVQDGTDKWSLELGDPTGFLWRLYCSTRKLPPHPGRWQMPSEWAWRPPRILMAVLGETRSGEPAIRPATSHDETTRRCLVRLRLAPRRKAELFFEKRLRHRDGSIFKWLDIRLFALASGRGVNGRDHLFVVSPGGGFCVFLPARKPGGPARKVVLANDGVMMTEVTEEFFLGPKGLIEEIKVSLEPARVREGPRHGRTPRS